MTNDEWELEPDFADLMYERGRKDGFEKAIGIMLGALDDTNRLIDEVVAAGTPTNNGTKEFVASLCRYLIAAALGDGAK